MPYNSDRCINLNSERGDDWNYGIEALELFDHDNGLPEWLEDMKTVLTDDMEDSIKSFKAYINNQLLTQFNGKIINLPNFDDCDYIEFASIEDLVHFKLAYMLF